MLSFIVPVYNTKEYLPKCIDSLLDSGIIDYEIILVDDGSTDGSDIICKKYQRNNPGKIRLLNRKNRGVSSARNAGLEVASGDYIMFVDSDDRLFGGLSDTDLNDDFDIMMFCYSTAEVAKQLDNKRNVSIIKKEKVAKQIFDRIPTGGFNYKTPWAKIYRKDIIDQNHLRFDEDLTMGEDMVFNLYYFMHCNRCVMVNRELYHYEVQEGSMSHTFDLRKRENDRIFNNHLKNLIDEIPELNSCKFLYWDNVICSIALAFLSILKKYGGSENAIRYIEELEEENLKKEPLQNCSCWVKKRYKMIYWFLLYHKGKWLYCVMGIALKGKRMLKQMKNRI